MSGRALIGVKRMGELDAKPFQVACKRKYSSEEADVKAIEICTSWEERLRDPDWHPFKIIKVGNNHQVFFFCLVTLVTLAQRIMSIIYV